MTKRTYRTDCSAELARIEARRMALSLTHEELARAASIATRTYLRMRQDGRAFRRHVTALRFALRTLEQRQRAATRILDGAGA